MRNFFLILNTQQKIFKNYLRHEFAAKTLVEIGFALFLIVTTAIRFHQDIGFAWVHTSRQEVAAVIQNSLFGIFFLFCFSIQLTGRNAISIPSGDALLSLPFREKDIYFFRANVFLARVLPWFFAALFFWTIAWIRFQNVPFAVHLTQILATGLLLIFAAELFWTLTMAFKLLFPASKPALKTAGLILMELLLFLILALSREDVLFLFHPAYVFSIYFLAAVFSLTPVFLALNYVLFRQILRREKHLEFMKRPRTGLFRKISDAFFRTFPHSLRALIDLTVRTQFRTNRFFKALILIFGILLLIGWQISHSAADFADNTMFGVLVFYIMLSAAFFGNQKESQKEITFYKSQPLGFGQIWRARFLGLLLIYEFFSIFYFVLTFFLFGNLSLPAWPFILLLLFPVFLCILQTNFYLTLLQNVKTGEYLYMAFWVVNWTFWFVFPFLQMFFLLAGAFAVKPARTRFEWVEESW